MVVRIATHIRNHKLTPIAAMGEKILFYSSEILIEKLSNHMNELLESRGLYFKN